jgi:hypothetical protein
MITVKTISGRKEYTEVFTASCGHEQVVVTLGYKMTRKQAKIKRENLCTRCQLMQLLGNPTTEVKRAARNIIMENA